MKKKYFIIATMLICCNVAVCQTSEDVSLVERNQGVVLESTLKERDAEITRLREENKKLAERITITDQNLPNIISYRDRNIHHNKALYLFETNRPGKLKVTLIQNNNFIQEWISPVLQTNHIYESRPLTSDETYSLKVEVLDFTGSPTRTKLTSQDIGELRFKTLTTSQAPVVSSIKLEPQSTPTSASIKVNYRLENDGYVALTCYERISGMDSWRIVKSQSHGGKVNDLGKISAGTKVAGGVLNDYAFSDLKNNTEYKISIQTYSGEGQASAVKSEVITTPDKSTDLFFASPVKVKFSTLRSEVSWKYSTKPDNAEVIISDESNPDVQVRYPKPKLNDATKQMEVEMLNMTDLNKVLNMRSPIIEIAMTKDAKKVEQKFSVQFEIPKSSDLRNRRTELGQNADEIIKAVQDVEGKKKVKWEGIAKIGLPLLVTLL